MKKVLLLLMAAALMGMPVEAKKKDKKKKGKAKTEAAAADTAADCPCELADGSSYAGQRCFFGDHALSCKARRLLCDGDPYKLRDLQ